MNKKKPREKLSRGFRVFFNPGYPGYDSYIVDECFIVKPINLLDLFLFKGRHSDGREQAISNRFKISLGDLGTLIFPLYQHTIQPRMADMRNHITLCPVRPTWREERISIRHETMMIGQDRIGPNAANRNDNA